MNWIAAAPRAWRIGACRAALVLQTVGCSHGPAVTREACIDHMAFALTDAHPLTALPLSAGALAAIGALEDPGTHQVMCTGTYVGDRFVLTARHCVLPPGNGLVFRSSQPSRVREVLVAEERAHPELDVMLVRLPPDPALDGLEALTLWDSASSDWEGEKLTLAGMGTRSDGSSGMLEFLEETVLSTTHAAIVVDGGPDHGACQGDSGGPLLAEASDGSVQVVGVLMGGSSNCRGRDRYLPTSAFAAWVSRVRVAALAEPCADVTTEGMCDFGTARWCAGSYVAAERCGSGSTCAWDAAAGGYRCLRSEEDPCLGTPPEGSCDGTTLRACRRGVVVETECAECGLACAWDGNGRASCQ